MRAALYTRVACANQETKHAIVSQLETLRDYAASHGLEIIEEFTDEGCSGLRLDRPGLDRMRGLAKRFGFDVVLTCGPDRLARSFRLQVFIIEELKRCGVQTIFLDQRPADEPLSLLREIRVAGAELKPLKGTKRDRHGACCQEMASSELPSGYGRIPGSNSTASHLEMRKSEDAIIQKSFDVGSCLPAHERNEWERDLDSFNQGVE